MMRNSNQRITESRRGVLKLAGSYTALGGFTPLSATSEVGTVPIVIVRGGDGTPRQIRRVPARWWNHEQKVLDAQEKLQKRFGIFDSSVNSGIDGVGIGTQTERISGRYKSNLIVYTNPGQPTQQDVPSAIDGIPVSLMSTPNYEPDSCNKQEFKYLAGGVAVDEIDDSGPGSTTCMVEKFGTYYMMSAAHIFRDGCTSPIGVEAYNYTENGNYIGDVAYASIAEDWVLIPRAPNSDITAFDNGIEDQPGILSGHVTKNGLLDMKSTNETVYHQGWRTCETSGYVDRVDIPNEVCGNTDYHYVELTTPTLSGDSGGPHFHKYTYNNCYYLAIIAPHYGGESIGCAAYHINATQGISFDPQFSLC